MEGHSHVPCQVASSREGPEQKKSFFDASRRNKPENHIAKTTLHLQCPTPVLPIPFTSAVYPMGHCIRFVVIVSSEGLICLNISVGSNLLVCCG